MNLTHLLKSKSKKEIKESFNKLEANLINEFMNKTFSSIVIAKNAKDENDSIIFKNDKESIIMTHIQDCCENVIIKDIIGDLENLINEPILLAEERIKQSGESGDLTHTYTFYTFATKKGYVDILWHGSSNGYYSEEVNIIRGKN